MRRSGWCTAPHGFDINTWGLLMFRKKRITYRNAIFAARPPGKWEHGSLSFGKPLSQLSLVFQGSKDFNPRSATPSDVRSNRRIIISLADHGEAVFTCFVSRMDRSAQSCRLVECDIVRHGASLITLPVLGTCLRVEYSIIKVGHAAR